MNKFSIFLLSTLFINCVPEKPACSQAKLAEIQAAYAKALFEKCDGKTLATCDTKEIDAEFSRRNLEWVTCK